jgi:hypothetical protein
VATSLYFAAMDRRSTSRSTRAMPTSLNSDPRCPGQRLQRAMLLALPVDDQPRPDVGGMLD